MASTDFYRTLEAARGCKNKYFKINALYFLSFGNQIQTFWIVWEGFLSFRWPGIYPV